MSAHSDSDSNFEDSGSEAGYAETYSIPRQFSPLAWQVFCTKLLPALSLHFAQRPAWQNLKIVPNAAMSLMAHLLVFQSGGVEGISTNRCLAWWSGAVGPITAGCVIVNRKLDPMEEANFERAMVGRPGLTHEEIPEPNNYHSEHGEVRISIDSTKLTSNAQSDLIQLIEVGRLRLSVWSIPAVVVLATNDLLKSMERTEEEAGESAYLVATLTASMSLWRIATPDEDRRQGEWLAASGMLIGRDRRASLLVSDFNNKIRKLLSPAHSSALGEEAVSRWMMPGSSGATALMDEIRGYMPRRDSITAAGPHRPSPSANPYRRRGSSSSPERRRSRSPSRSLAKSPFTPQPRWHF